jgi:hypothetical protein
VSFTAGPENGNGDVDWCVQGFVGWLSIGKHSFERIQVLIRDGIPARGTVGLIILRVLRTRPLPDRLEWKCHTSVVPGSALSFFRVRLPECRVISGRAALHTVPHPVHAVPSRTCTSAMRCEGDVECGFTAFPVGWSSQGISGRVVRVDKSYRL